jgi:hypothetical protein
MRLIFGKYKNHLVENIIKTDENYIRWLIKKKLIALPKNLKL